MRRAAPAPPPESAEMVQEILLKLPTRDVIRCCGVSRLWRCVVADPNFRSLHAEAEANHVSAASEALLVSITRESDWPDEASFFNVSSSRPALMPHRVIIPNPYSLSNVCNGLLCFVCHDDSKAPAFICNPVTGETATLPRAPRRHTMHHHLALAFSPSTKEHKLFSFTFSGPSLILGVNVDQCVYTLDGVAAGGGWRKRSYISECAPLLTLPPVLVQGKLYLVTTGRTEPGKPRNPDGLLEVDVATEAHRPYHLPFKKDEYHSAWDPQVIAFEMSGQLGLVVEIFGEKKTLVRKLQFWVLVSSGSDNDVSWNLRYSFYVDDEYRFLQTRSAWFDDREMTLCYKDYNALFKHNTRGHLPELSPDGDCPKCDRRLRLPRAPHNCQWNIFGGYRPTLLSPLTLALSSWDIKEERQKFEEERQEFEEGLLHTLRPRRRKTRNIRMKTSHIKTRKAKKDK
ncbi:hypothetical protein VPH35_108181 [Triticum aestivum]